MIRGKRARLGALICVFAGVLALSGCASLPRSGDVHAVEGRSQAEGNVGLFAQPPAQDAFPEDIVTGFLAACQAGFDDDFAVARQYLLGQISGEWNPLDSVRIYPDTANISLSRADSGAVHAEVAASGTVNRQGIYTPASSSASVAMDYSLARNSEGQWRIVSLDDGILVPEQSFLDLYAESPLYFLSADSSALVPDVRFFPKRSFASDAVRALLEGPADWLAAGVRTAAPDETTLASEGVEVSEGNAIVHLSAHVLSASQADLGAFLTQLTNTLTVSSSIDTVDMYAGQSRVDVETASELAPYPFGSYPLSALAGSARATIRDGSVVAGSEVNGAESLHGLASEYAAGGGRLAALNAEGTQLVLIGEDSSEIIAEGGELVEPSFDSFGWIWTAEAANPGTLVALDGSGERVELDASWLRGARLGGIAVSREGSRLVALVSEGETTRLVAAAISRGGSHEPAGVSDPVTVGIAFSSIADVAWTSQTQLAVLASPTSSAGSGAGSGGAGEMGLYSVQVGGLTQRLTAPREGATSLTAGLGQQSITLLTEQGDVYALGGGAWNLQAQGVSSIAYPG